MPKLSAKAQPALTCRECVELVTEYLEGTLLPASCTRFETHTAICAGCQIYLAQTRQTIRLLGTLAETAVPPLSKVQLLQLFRDWKRNRYQYDAC